MIFSLREWLQAPGFLSSVVLVSVNIPLTHFVRVHRDHREHYVASREAIGFWGSVFCGSVLWNLPQTHTDLHGH